MRDVGLRDRVTPFGSLEMDVLPLGRGVAHLVEQTAKAPGEERIAPLGHLHSRPLRADMPPASRDLWSRRSALPSPLAGLRGGRRTDHVRTYQSPPHSEAPDCSSRALCVPYPVRRGLRSGASPSTIQAQSLPKWEALRSSGKCRAQKDESRERCDREPTLVKT